MICWNIFDFKNGRGKKRELLSISLRLNMKGTVLIIIVMLCNGFG